MRRFLIRDLFWLTLVVAALLGWYVDRAPLANKLSDVQVRLRVSEARVHELEYAVRDLKRDFLTKQVRDKGWSELKAENERLRMELSYGQ